jgi:hypothetical protein
MKSPRWKILTLVAASPLMGFCIATGEENPKSARAPHVTVGQMDCGSVVIVQTRHVDVTMTPIRAVNEAK